MNCSRCGSLVSAGDRFCGECGAAGPFEPAPTTADPSSISGPPRTESVTEVRRGPPQETSRARVAISWTTRLLVGAALGMSACLILGILYSSVFQPRLPFQAAGPAPGSQNTAAQLATAQPSVAPNTRQALPGATDTLISPRSPSPTALPQSNAGSNVTDPPGGKIAFASKRDGDWEIYTLNAAGSGLTRLTRSPGYDWAPAWSPDGRRIAFGSKRDGNWELYMMGADGSGATRLTNNAAGDWNPTWSPDGAQLLFETFRDGNGEIYVMNADGSAAENLTRNPFCDLEPAWSPDGKRIVFVSDRDDPDPDKCGNGSNPECVEHIYVMNADGTGKTRLTNQAAIDSEPAWSPDGKWIVFASTVGDSNPLQCGFNEYPACDRQLYRMNPDGSGVTPLTDIPAGASSPAWSSDGKWIAYVSTVNDASGIFLLEFVRGTPRALTSEHDMDPAWQPGAGP